MMRVTLCIAVLCSIGVVNCGVLSSQIVTQLPTAVTTSQRVGGNFLYSTVESRSLPSVAVSYNAYPLPVTAPLPVAHPLYSQSIFGSQFFNPIISSPFYPGIVGQAPVIGQGPILGQYPIFGQLPGQGQVPIQAPVAPVAPVAPPTQGVPQGPAPPPPGATVDDDTVSVEAA